MPTLYNPNASILSEVCWARDLCHRQTCLEVNITENGNEHDISMYQFYKENNGDINGKHTKRRFHVFFSILPIVCYLQFC